VKKRGLNLFEIVNEIGEDVGHANTSKTPILGFIKTFKDKIQIIHLHDNDGITDSHLPIGRRNINFKEVFIALNDIKTITYHFSLK